MKYPKIIFVGSFDPMTRSHSKTWELASKKFNKMVDLVICKNDLKNKGMFSLKKREMIIKNFYPNYGKV